MIGLELILLIMLLLLLLLPLLLLLLLLLLTFGFWLNLLLPISVEFVDTAADPGLVALVDSVSLLVLLVDLDATSDEIGILISEEEEDEDAT